MDRLPTIWAMTAEYADLVQRHTHQRANPPFTMRGSCKAGMPRRLNCQEHDIEGLRDADGEETDQRNATENETSSAASATLGNSADRRSTLLRRALPDCGVCTASLERMS